MAIRDLILSGLVAASLSHAAVATADEARPRTVTVSGQGEISAQPDMARITLGVEARRPTMTEARSLVATVVDKVLALCRDLKIDPKFVNATRLQVQPEYSWNAKDRRQVLLGYRVSRQVEVELRNLDQLGPLLERAVDAGVNQVGDPMLDSTKRKELERQAMALAVQDARLNAETLAQAAGTQLGPVRSLNASSAPTPMPMYRMTMAAADAAAPPPSAPYQAGDMKFSATVAAEYDLVVRQ